MIPFYLITGFLGSGKTSFLKSILANVPAGERIAVIQNEFAPAGIDGITLKNNAPAVQLVEINNGSVFCACLMGDFIETLQKIVSEYQPHKIFLEASGLADPGTLTQVMSDVRIDSKLVLGGSVCIADAKNFALALSKIPRVVQQIRVADVVLVNKTDLIDEVELDKVAEKIRVLNPYAQIKFTTHGQVNADFFQELVIPHVTKQKLFFRHQGAERPDLKSGVVKTTQKINHRKVELFLEQLSLISLRAKGFINLSNSGTILFQSVFGSFTYEPYFNYPENTEFVAIGDDVDSQVLFNLFAKYFD